MVASNNFATSRVVSVGAAPEATEGVAVFPTSAQIIKPSSFPDSNQERPLENSDERINSRDIVAQFQGQRGAATLSFSMYNRPAGTAATESAVGAPQGDVLLNSFFGRTLTASGMQINGAGVDDSVTTIPFDGLVGEVPRRGVVKIENEFIYYSGVAFTDDAKSAGSFTGATRGYQDSTAAAHADDTAISVWSRTYAQALNTPSFTYWVRKDFLYQRVTGATLNTMSIAITNSGGQNVEMSGEGFLQSSVSNHDLSAGSANAATTYTTSTPTYVEVGMRIQNATKDDDNGGAGYEVTAVSGTTVTISPGVQDAAGWDSGDVITGYLPSFTDIGDPIENRQNIVRIGDVTFPIISTTLSLSEPKTYPTNEVNGEDHPTGYYEGQREYTMDLSFYFRPSSMALYQDAFNSIDRPIEIISGTGLGDMVVYDIPRAKLSSPTVTEDGDTITMSISTTMLGTEGEDSFQMRFE